MIILVDILCFVGVLLFCIGYAVNKQAFSAKDECWGVRVNPGGSIAFGRSLRWVGLALAAVGWVLWIVEMVNQASETDMDFVSVLVLPGVLALIPIPIGLPIGRCWALSALQKRQDALLLGRFEPIRIADANMRFTKKLEIYPDGFALYDQNDRVLGVIRFAQHSLRDLGETPQMMMLSAYFMQRYPHVFRRKLSEQIVTVNTVNAQMQIVQSRVAGVNVLGVCLIRK